VEGNSFHITGVEKLKARLVKLVVQEGKGKTTDSDSLCEEGTMLV